MAQINIGRVLPIFRGEYDTDTTYEKLDIVSYQGSSYVAKGNTIHNLPTNTTYWRLVAKGGTWTDMTEEEKEEVIERLADELADLSYEDGEIIYSTGKEIMLQNRAKSTYLWPTTQAKSVWDGSQTVHDKLSTMSSNIGTINTTLTTLSDRIEEVNEGVNEAISNIYATYHIQVTDGYVSHSRLSVEGAEIVFDDDDGTTYSKILDSTGYFCFALKGDTTYTVYINIDGETHEELEDAETGVRRVNYDYD